MYKNQRNKTIKEKPAKLNTVIMNEKPRNDITANLNAIAETIETQAKIMKNIKPLLDGMKDLREELNRENSNATSGINKDEEIVITSFNLPKIT